MGVKGQNLLDLAENYDAVQFGKNAKSPMPRGSTKFDMTNARADRSPDG